MKRWLLEVHTKAPNLKFITVFEADNRAGVIDLFYNWLRLEGDMVGGYRIEYYEKTTQ